MFDPFGDYEAVGYLRNHAGEKDLELIKIAEHQLFRAQLPKALKYLEQAAHIDYAAFLRVHQILFEGLYPWAGMDRATVAPDKHVTKGHVHFCHPFESQRAVVHALHLAQEKGRIADAPGLIMGLFAYTHPFLDGNGRAMLLVHAELCHRAGFSVNWTATRKDSYLAALTAEIESPDQGHLDGYLRPYIGPQLDRHVWSQRIDGLRGLDGVRTGEDQVAAYEDPAVAAGYDAFDQARNYHIPE